LDHYKVDFHKKHVVILGRSNIVGKPMAALLLHTNVTVTIANRYTKHLADLCKTADILIAATGNPHLVKENMVQEGACVIDVGISKITDEASLGGTRVVGDVDFENVKDKCSSISPVPGGVGPMTIASLMLNTIHSYIKREHAH
jgi:methylenetetrahydrofolate dehydrogenase (NADP+)/methenyltetrahydrofolate cyclohydrolase